MIGLGQMGLPIARNLMEAGFAVTGYRRSGSPELAAAGGTVAASPAEVAAGADVLLSIVPDVAAVDEVIRGPAGHAHHAAARHRAHRDEHHQRGREEPGSATRSGRPGGDLLDCPISGSPAMVAPRGPPPSPPATRPAWTRCAPVLDAVSGPWVYTGEFGTGARMKYIANLLLAVHTVAAAEALALARRSGLDLELVQHTLDSSIAESAIWRQRAPVMARRAWSPAPGPVRTLHPILEQIEDCAAAAGLTTPVFAAAKAVFDQALADGWGDLDIACVHDQISGLSALPTGLSALPSGDPS